VTGRHPGVAGTESSMPRSSALTVAQSQPLAASYRDIEDSAPATPRCHTF
jgi:hypothetical protein